MTWALIIVFASTFGASGMALSSVAVPGYITEKACKEAADAVPKGKDGADVVFCIPGPAPLGP